MGSSRLGRNRSHGRHVLSRGRGRHAAAGGRRRGLLRPRLSTLAAALAVLALLAPPAMAPAAEAAAQVTARKAVEADADLDGTVRRARVLSELQIRGDGRVEVYDPVGAATPRRLDSWGRPVVQRGEARWQVDVDGVETLRTVADYDDDLPVAARVRLTADGAPTEPDALAEATGDAAARVQVRNTSAERRLLSWREAGEGRMEHAEVPVPLIAQVTATFDDGWTQVDAPAGTVVTDADGTTTVTWVALLFEPFGELTTTLEAAGVVDGAQPPEVTVEAAPLITDDAEGLRGGVAMLRDGQVDAAVLAFALAELGGGVDELADGLLELVGGLGELADGTGELAGGIGEAAGGAGELSVGAGELGGGASQLAGGLRELAGGTEQLAGGAGELSAGASELADGTDELAGGARQLADGTGEFVGGVGELADGTAALADGAAQLEPAAAGVAEGLAGLAEAVENLPEPPDGLDDLPVDEIGAVVADLQARLEGLSAALEDAGRIEQQLAEAIATLQQLQSQLDQLEDREAADELGSLVETATAQLDEAAATAAQTRERIAEIAGGAAEGLGELAALLEQLAGLDADLDLDVAPGEAMGELVAAAEAVAGGVSELRAGLVGLAEGAAAAAGGGEELVAGAEGLADGTAGVAAGAGGLAGGAGELAGGAAGLAEGTRGTAEGAQGLADGAFGLAGGIDGLAQALAGAAGGAEGLADGTAGAADGAGGAAEGAGALGDAAGTGAGAGDDIAGSLARDLALLEAMDERARTDGVPLGAPADAEATGAYRLVLSDDAPAGLDPRWPAAAALLALGGLLPGWVTRRPA